MSARRAHETSTVEYFMLSVHSVARLILDFSEGPLFGEVGRGIYSIPHCIRLQEQMLKEGALQLILRHRGDLNTNRAEDSLLFRL